MKAITYADSIAKLKKRLQPLDPENNIDALDNAEVDEELDRRLNYQGRRDFIGDYREGVNLLRHFVAAVDAGVVPDPELLKATATCFSKVLTDCSEDSITLATDNRETGKAFTKAFGLHKITRQTDPRLDYWALNVDVAYQELKLKGESNALITAIEKSTNPPPTTQQEFNQKKSSYRRWYDKQSKPTMGELIAQDNKRRGN